MTKQDDFSEAVKKTIAARAGYKCSICDAPTSGPDATGQKAVNVGVAAHITAASEGGPRYEASLSHRERRSIGNAIWTCQNHGHIIDTDQEQYTVDRLRLNDRG